MTEQTILRRGIAFSSPSLAPWPVHLVRLHEIGLDDSFVKSVRPSFDRTQWDQYDVTAGVLQFLSGQPAPVAAQAATLLQQPASQTRNAAVKELLDTLPSAMREEAALIRPHRRRAIRRYGLERTSAGEWAITALPDTTFRQAVTDYRAAPRTFALMEEAITFHPGVLALLTSAAETANAVRPDAQRLDAYIHQVTVMARAQQTGHPAPEGLHQDGADFIISAMVMERDNIRGGVSRIFEGQHGTQPLLEIELQPGQGIFQMDAGSDLWHEVSPVAVDDPSRDGHRMTFGIDLHVV